LRISYANLRADLKTDAGVSQSNNSLLGPKAQLKLEPCFTSELWPLKAWESRKPSSLSEGSKIVLQLDHISELNSHRIIRIFIEATLKFDAVIGSATALTSLTIIVLLDVRCYRERNRDKTETNKNFFFLSELKHLSLPSTHPLLLLLHPRQDTC